MVQRDLPQETTEAQLPLTTGVYGIFGPNDRAYIGSAADIMNRWTYHRCRLRQGRHHSVKLQRAWLKYGLKAFRFEILHTCSTDKLAEWEQRYIDGYDSYRAGYNCQPFARSTRGYKHTAATVAKMSAAAIRVGADPAERARRSQRAKLQHEAGRLGRQTWRT